MTKEQEDQIIRQAHFEGKYLKKFKKFGMYKDSTYFCNALRKWNTCKQDISKTL